MSSNQHFKELLLEFNDRRVRYLVIGAYAVMYHSEPRYTKDIDLWIDIAGDNPERAFGALTEFGAPLHDLSVEDLGTPGVVFQIGIEPSRIDILTAPAGVEFDGAWTRRIKSTYDGVPTQILSLQDLIASKRASGRPQDLLDLEKLEKIPGW